MSFDKNVCRSIAALTRYALIPVLTCWCAASHASAQTAGPVAAYAFSETSGTTAADSAGNGNDATLFHVSAWSSAGRFGRGLTLDGVNNGVWLPVTSSLALGSAFTIEAWIKPTTIGPSQIILYRPDDLLFMVLPSGALYVTATLSGGYRAMGSSITVPAAEWSHVALTYDGAALRVYLNGIGVGAVAATGSLPSSSTAPLVGGVQYNSPFVGL